jgi:hypothetical protein
VAESDAPYPEERAFYLHRLQRYDDHVDASDSTDFLDEKYITIMHEWGEQIKLNNKK